MPAEWLRARRLFVERLSTEQREALLELELLLSGVACLASPRNHPGARLKQPLSSVDFRPALQLAHDGILRLIELAEGVLGPRARGPRMHRYLGAGLSEQLDPPGAADTPEGALAALRSSLTHLSEVCASTLSLQPVPFRLFYAFSACVQREVSHNTFFCPPHALEFRPESDCIPVPCLLEALGRLQGDAPRQAANHVLLSLFRMLGHLDLAQRLAAATRSSPGVDAARIHLAFAVLRSEERALAFHLGRRSGAQLADAFEAELLREPAHELASRQELIRAQGTRLIALREAFDCVEASLRQDFRTVYEHVLPSPLLPTHSQPLPAAALHAVSMLRPAIQGAIAFLASTLGAETGYGQLFGDPGSRRNLSARLRQNTWMFSQITRAFLVKLRHAQGGAETWTTASGLQFVGEFLLYFRAMGRPLLEHGHYPRRASLIAAMAYLQAPHDLDSGKRQLVQTECEAFQEHLRAQVDQVSLRPELAGVPFDTRQAASVLRKYLGH